MGKEIRAQNSLHGLRCATLSCLQALKWELCPVTIVSWLNLYLQVDALKDVPKVLLPQYSQEKFIQIAQVGCKLCQKMLFGVTACTSEYCIPRAIQNAFPCFTLPVTLLSNVQV